MFWPFQQDPTSILLIRVFHDLYPCRTVMESKVRLGFSASLSASILMPLLSVKVSKKSKLVDQGAQSSQGSHTDFIWFHKISAFVQGLRDTARHLLKFFVTVAGTELPDSCPEETQALSLVSTSWVVWVGHRLCLTLFDAWRSWSAIRFINLWEFHLICAAYIKRQEFVVSLRCLGGCEGVLRLPTSRVDPWDIHGEVESTKPGLNFESWWKLITMISWRFPMFHIVSCHVMKFHEIPWSSWFVSSQGGSCKARKRLNHAGPFARLRQLGQRPQPWGSDSCSERSWGDLRKKTCVVLRKTESEVQQVLEWSWLISSKVISYMWLQIACPHDAVHGPNVRALGVPRHMLSPGPKIFLCDSNTAPFD